MSEIPDARMMLDRWAGELTTGKVRRISANSRQSAVSPGGVKLLLDHGLMSAALDIASDIGPLHPAAQRRFVRSWIRYGSWIRNAVDDALMFDALWQLLPPYTGTKSLQLFRGQLWGRKSDDLTYLGASWTDDFDLARKFAMVGDEQLKPPGKARDAQIETRRTRGEPTVIQATIAPDQIICAVQDHGKTRLFSEREFIVDPRRLRPDDLSMITTDELHAIQQQLQIGRAGARP